MASYKRNLRLHVRPHIGGRQLQRLDAGHLNALYAQLGERLSARTTRYVATIVHRALRDAVRWGRLVRNPSDASDPPKPQEAPEMKTWTSADLARFLSIVEGNRYRVAWLTLATTGCRRGELLGLRWGDVDFENGRLAIRRTVTSVDHAIVVASRTKTGKGRAVDLDATTIAELRAHRVMQSARVTPSWASDTKRRDVGVLPPRRKAVRPRPIQS